MRDGTALDGRISDPALRERLTSTVLGNRARVQLITGPIGAGKTALAAAVSERLRRSGRRVLTIAGVEGIREQPYAALLPLLAELAPDIGQEAALRRLFAIAAPSRAKPVLVIDEAAAIDEPTAATAAQLVRVYGLAAIVTARSRRTLPGALTRLATEGLVSELRLSWNAEVPDRAGTGIADAVGTAIESLAPAARRIAEALAMIGPLPSALVDDPGTVDALEDAGLLSPLEDGVLRLPHPTFALAIRNRLPRSRLPEFEDALGALTELAAAAGGGETALAAGVRTVGYHLAVELRKPDAATELGRRGLARLADPVVTQELGRHVESWRSMAGVMLAEQGPPGAEPVAAAVRGHQRIAAALFTGDVDGGRAAIAETLPLIALAGPALGTGTLVPDVAEYHFTAFEGGSERLAQAERAHSAEDGPSAGMWDLTFAYFRLRRGAVEEALELAAAACETLPREAFFGSRAIAFALRATAAAQLGRRAEARDALAQLSVETRPWALAELQAAEAEAWLLDGEGRREEATTRLADALAQAAEANYWSYGAITAIAAIRMRRPATVVPFLESATAASRAPVVRLVHELAVAERDATGVEEARARLRTAGLLPAPGAARHPDGLTPREQEITAAAAAGRRSRDIAAALGLSTRTVETHLQNAYRKLGIGSREELETRIAGRER